MKAYVLINVRPGKTRDVLAKVKQIQGVKSADACWGRPDLFTLVDIQDQKALADTVLARIHAVDGIESTDTHIVIE